MITPDNFPYIKSLHVNDCYADQNFDIDLHDYKPFSHLILTGKNGSGKSTVLRAMANIGFNGWIGNGIDSLVSVKLVEYGVSYVFPNRVTESVYSFIQAKRNSKVASVSSISRDDELMSRIHMGETVSFFKQFLVNMKVAQAFNQIDNDHKKIEEIEYFFNKLTEVFREALEDAKLELVFDRKNFEFFLKLSDGRLLTFDTLSEGYSALLSILMDLLMRVDLIRKQVGDYSYNPCGIVLIDEPETHLHLQLQEQVLPLLTSLFPNIQFIAATHSPAVIASIKNATIFDLTTKESRGSEEIAGRSYSDLMVSHFGLENEYSETADQIIRQVNDVLNTLAEKPAEKKAALQKIYDDNSAYLSPTLQVELEMLIVQHNVQHESAR